MSSSTASTSAPEFKSLNVAIIGGGIGGLASAVSLRRAGHAVTIYERYDYAGEVGASISCANNGTKWLFEWGVDVQKAKPVTLRNLIMHDWKTGNVINEYPLKDYKEKWGTEYYMFHRQDIHAVLKETALMEEGEGIPAKLVVNHRAKTIDCEAGKVTFEDGTTIEADLIVGADGIRSTTRSEIGVVPDMKPASVACYRCNILTKTCHELGLKDFAETEAIDYWGGWPSGEKEDSQYYKIVLAGCRGGEVLSFYNFMPAHLTTQRKEGFRYEEVTVEEMIKNYGDLDPKVLAMLENSFDRMPWRLYVHQEYPYWSKGKVTLLGDAAHPMLPNQSQGAVQALEDAAALGITFSRKYGYTTPGNVERGLKIYERVRKPRAWRVQDASVRATENMNERIGFSSTPWSQTKHTTTGVLTIDEMNLYDMKKDVEFKSQDLPAL